MSVSNAFMASAKKSQYAQSNIEKSKTIDDEMIVTNIRIPKSLHRKAQLHRVETGESITALIRRLMENELSG